jgi:hypothetical protein
MIRLPARARKTERKTFEIREAGVESRGHENAHLETCTFVLQFTLDNTENGRA